MRGSSNPFLTAKELLKPPMEDIVANKESGGFYTDGSGESLIEGKKNGTHTDTSSAVTSSIRAKANAAAASLNSPTKVGRAVSKKQQKLAEAAKSSRNIFQYFDKIRTTEKREETVKTLDAVSSQTTAVSPTEDISQQQHSPASVVDVESSPAESETQDVKQSETQCDVIVLDESEEEEPVEVEKLEQVQDTCEESVKSTTE